MPLYLSRQDESVLKECGGLLYHLFNEEEEPFLKSKGTDIHNLAEEKLGLKALMESPGYSVRAKTHSFGFESKEDISNLKPSISLPLAKSVAAGEYFFVNFQVASKSL